MLALKLGETLCRRLLISLSLTFLSAKMKKLHFPSTDERFEQCLEHRETFRVFTLTKGFLLQYLQRRA